MNNIFFRTQIERLINKWGERNFPQEVVKLIWVEVETMSELGFKRAIEAWLGEFPISRPPRVSHFREAAQKEKQERFRAETRAAAGALKTGPEEMRTKMNTILSKHFGAVDGVKSAMEIAKLKIRTGGGDPEPGGAA